MNAPLQDALEAAIRAATGSSFRLAGSRPVSGGDIHASLLLEGAGGERYFVKHGDQDAAVMFEAEADGLAALSASAAARVPEVIATGSTDDAAFLVLEWLDLRPVSSEEDGVRAAEALTRLHQCEGEHFGWHRDNFLGRSPQRNTPLDNWSRFFAEFRLKPQLELARAKGYAGELQRNGEKILERLPALFLDYRPRPSLLHGDLWHGNFGMLADGEPVLFDPAVHYGDHEADLAMTELFGGFPGSFYATCRKEWPPAQDAEDRKPLYTLYHLLNHLNLFGRGYLGQVERIARKL
ncbi:MAG: fructosamine kinase family protein, partial [Zoogloea sp.]|nr:fructosamine kinase family protein [Zoogloea sp.]